MFICVKNDVCEDGVPVYVPPCLGWDVVLEMDYSVGVGAS